MVTTRFDKRFLLVAFGLMLVLLAILPATPSNAQTYRFSLPTYEVEAYIEAMAV
jgi:di/tricarboxylate transporter